MRHQAALVPALRGKGNKEKQVQKEKNDTDRQWPSVPDMVVFLAGAGCSKANRDRDREGNKSQQQRPAALATLRLTGGA